MGNPGIEKNIENMSNSFKTYIWLAMEKNAKRMSSLQQMKSLENLEFLISTTVKSRVEARVTIQKIKSLGVLQTETCPGAPERI